MAAIRAIAASSLVLNEPKKSGMLLILIHACHFPVVEFRRTPVTPVVLFRLVLLFICCSELVAHRQLAGS